MKNWYYEEYSFKITVLSIKPDNEPLNHCRNGHEVGDEFSCEYGCPDKFCSKSMLKLFPLMEAVRSGGTYAILVAEISISWSLNAPMESYGLGWRL